MFCRSYLARGTARKCHLRQTEIQNLGVPALGDEDVRGLDVAMDDAFSVGSVERIRNLNGQREQVFSLHGSPAIRCFRVMPSRYSMAMNVWPSCFTDFVDRADVRMVQGRSGLSLALEAGQCLRVLRDFVRQKLQGDKTVQPSCPRPCRRHPSRRRRASRRCGSARSFGRSWKRAC